MSFESSPTSLGRMAPFRVHGLGGSLLSLLAIAIASTCAWFESADGLAYRTIWSLPQASRSPQAKTLLVESDADALSTQEGERLLGALLELGAAVVAFNDIPQQATAGFFEQARSSGRTVFGRPLVRSKDDPEVWVASPLPPAFTAELPTALVPPPPIEYGLVRRQRLDFIQNGERAAVLEAAVARRLGVELPGTPSFLVNFSALGALPRVRAEQVLAAQLTPELVRGRAVLVGRPADAYTPGLPTPVGEISPLILQGIALNTLLQADWIVAPRSATRVGLLLAAALACLFAFQVLSLRLALTVLSIAGVVGIGLAWAGLALLRLWLPWLEMSLTMLSVFFFVYRSKASEESSGLTQMLYETSAKLQRRAMPGGFLDSAEQWALVTALVDQTLSVTRMVFLERQAGDKRTREIAALRCTLQDIHERRRDFERTPYSIALEKRGVIQVQERLFFKPVDEGEMQFLCPLVFAGEVLGFWAFGLGPQQYSVGLAQTVNEIGNQVAELVYQRKLRQQQREGEGRALSRYLRDGASKASGELRQAIGLLERRLISFEGVFQESGVASIVYDLFGRVIFVNRRMSGLLADSGLAPYEMTAKDLGVALTGLTAGEWHDALHQVILERRALTLSARLPKNASDGFLLSLRPVWAPEVAGATTREPHPFQIEGLLLELIDISDLLQFGRARSALVERINYKLRGDLQTLITAIDLLQGPNRATHQEVVGILVEKASESARFIEDLQGLFVHGTDADFAQRMPVDGRAALLEAIAAMQGRAEQRQVRISVQAPELISFVFASPQGLGEVFEALLSFVIEDAAAEGLVTLSVVERDRRVRFDFADEGFGLPEHRLAEIIDGDGILTEGTLQSLRRAAHMVTAWQGRLQASSQVGEGSRLQLELEAFL